MVLVIFQQIYHAVFTLYKSRTNTVVHTFRQQLSCTSKQNNNTSMKPTNTIKHRMSAWGLTEWTPGTYIAFFATKPFAFAGARLSLVPHTKTFITGNQTIDADIRNNPGLHQGTAQQQPWKPWSTSPDAITAMPKNIINNKEASNSKAETDNNYHRNHAQRHRNDHEQSYRSHAQQRNHNLQHRNHHHLCVHRACPELDPGLHSAFATFSLTFNF